MSRTTYEEWGPQDQQVVTAPAGHPWLRLFGWFLLATYVHGTVDPGGGDTIGWSVEMVVLGWLARLFVKGVREDRIPVGRLWDLMVWLWLRFQILLVKRGPKLAVRLIANSRERKRIREAENRPTPAAIRAHSLKCGAGAYLGAQENGEWVTADRESAVMVLGPPRSGKTSAVIIPALLAATGPAISTSTKPDVMRATMSAREELGQIWLFDPTGEGAEEAGPIRRLNWSPVAASNTWDDALVLAKAMTAATSPGKGTVNESHWSERAAALLAPMLYAANLTDNPIEEVLRWTLRQDLAPAREILDDANAPIASDVLTGIEKTDARERSSIYSATAGVLAAYNADAARRSASNPNFDPKHFATSKDTIYITAPEHKQALCAPLIVGLLEQIRQAVYEKAQTHKPGPPMLWALDEIANIAPIHDLPALVSQAGGQSLQVMIGLQDLSQARARWGQAAADGFMSLFQTRLVLNGIADSRTLESISLSLGEYDRRVISTAQGSSERDEWFSTRSRSENTSVQTHRQRVLSPGEVASLPAGRGLLLRNGAWQLIRLTHWFKTEPWRSIAL